MEPSRLVWVMDTLSSHQTVPILNCYVVQEGKIVAFFSSDSQGRFSVDTNEDDLIDVLSKVYREHQLLSRLDRADPFACYFFLAGKRVGISPEELELYIKTGLTPNDLQLVQVPKPTRGPAEYLLRVKWGPSDYTTHLYTLDMSEKKEVKSQVVLKAASALAKDLLDAIKITSGKQLVALEACLVADDHKNLWISNVKKLSLKLKLPSKHKKRLSLTLRKSSVSKLNRKGDSKSKLKQQSKVSLRLKPSRKSKKFVGPALALNRMITSATLSLLDNTSRGSS